MDFVFLAAWVAGAIIVAGCTNGLKKIITRGPSWLWWVLSLVLSGVAGLSLAMSSGNYDNVLRESLGTWAVSQLFWDIILKRATAIVTGPIDTQKAG